MTGWKDLRHYWKLKQWAVNAWAVMQSRGRREGELAVRLHSGRVLTLRCDRQDYCIFDRIFLRDEYHLHDYIGEVNGCVVDIGANIGVFTCRIAGHVARVVSYEPMTSNVSLLKRNTSDFSNVEVVQGAVSGEPGMIRIYYPADETVSGGFSQFRVGALHQEDAYDDVDAVTLDMLFDRHKIDRCDLLKIDAEGAEYGILLGARPETLARIQRISGEYHNVRPGDPQCSMPTLKQRLESTGFTVLLQPKKGMDNHGLFFARR